MDFISSRENLFDYFESRAKNSKEELNNSKTKKTLMKSYIFETFNEELVTKKDNAELTNIPALFNTKLNKVKQIDNDIYSISNQESNIAYIEQINSRFSIAYTELHADKSDKIMYDYAKKSAILDSLWISSQMYDQFLKNIIDYHSPNRFTNIKFDSKPSYDKYNNEFDIVDNNNSMSSITQQIDGLQEKLNGVRNFFPLFNSISSLRFPSKNGAGGHDIYYNGKSTNRSSSFFDHREQLKNTVSHYQKTTENIEQLCWMEFERIPLKASSFESYKAAPVTITFDTEISSETLENFVKTVFTRGIEPFKIVGDSIEIEKNRFHIYGTDLHLWQNIFLDLSTTHFTLYLPKGTCGNTVHRLVTNIQKYLVPNFNVLIGDKPYKKIISNSMEEF